MSRLKTLAAEALAETDLGNSLLSSPADVDAAAEHLAETIREAQARAVEDIGWQWFYQDMPARDVSSLLKRIAHAIRNGTHWEDQ